LVATNLLVDCIRLVGERSLRLVLARTASADCLQYRFFLSRNERQKIELIFLVVAYQVARLPQTICPGTAAEKP